MTDHPITPPPELLKQWEDNWFDEREHADVLLIQAYQAGADAELDACCKWVSEESPIAATELRAARRPKPPSLKEQALEALSEMEDECLMVTQAATIRRALEALSDD